jgi:Protein of unknown function (DUF402)
VRVVKVKRPGGTFWWDFEPALEDEHGTWLYGPIGSRWCAPHEEGRSAVSALVLLHPDRPWVVWWVDDPADRRIELDVCLPPERTEEGWRHVDLELDPVRHERDFRIEIEDEDEYESSVREGWMSSEEARLARRAADGGARMLEHLDQPWSAGWRLLTALTRTT